MLVSVGQTLGFIDLLMISTIVGVWYFTGLFLAVVRGIEMEWQKELEAAKDAAERASQVLGKYLGVLKEIKTKPDMGLVSEADHESERVIKETFKSFGLNYAFLGEETGYTPESNSDYKNGRWIVDPLDGTTNFIHGFPYFSVSIALEVDGDLKVGVVVAPMMHLHFHAVRSQGAFMNGRRISVRNISSLEESFLATGFYYLKDEELSKQIEIFHRLIPQTHGVRRAGSAAIDLCYVAAGVFDGFWERGLQPWDTAAGVLMIEEAGGVITDYSGKPYSLKDSTILGASKSIHPRLLDETRKAQ